MSQEKRVHPRVDIRLSADVKHRNTEFTATTRNLSAGGVCLESSYRIAEGSDLALSLFLVVDGIEDEAMPSLQVRGTVQWTADDDEQHTYIAGVEFNGITDAQKRWLEQFLARTGGG